jgi:hypothetical protein
VSGTVATRVESGGGMSRERWCKKRGARSSKNEKLNACAEKGEKGNASFPDPVYIRQLTNEYRRACTVRPVPPYFCRFPVKTNEYKFIFIGFGTDEYNLNIFVGTDEFKNPNE